MRRAPPIFNLRLSARALRPLAGEGAYVLFAIGLIGAGFLAVPILTGSAAYTIAEGLGWAHGLDKKPHRAKAFYAVITASTLIGMLVNFVGINPMKALFWDAVFNGFITGPILVIIMLIANNQTVMGNRVNGSIANALGWITAVTMGAAEIVLILTWGQ